MRNRDISKDKQARKCKNNNMKRKEKMIRESGREERMGGMEEYTGIEFERT